MLASWKTTETAGAHRAFELPLLVTVLLATSGFGFAPAQVDVARGPGDRENARALIASGESGARRTVETFRSQRDGNWNEPSTWNLGTVPALGDRVAIAHDIQLSRDIAVGSGSGIAVEVLESGTFTVAEDVVLTVHGDFSMSGNVTLRAGAGLQMDTAMASELRITPGTTAAHLRAEGRPNQRCSVGAIGSAHTQITDGDMVGGGRIVATHTDFSRLGGPPNYLGYEYYNIGAPQAFRFEDCTFDRCSQFRHNQAEITNKNPASVGSIEFIRSRWTNSVLHPDPPPRWTVFETYSNPGMSNALRQCDFDQKVYLRHPVDYVIQDNVFRNGIDKTSGENGYEIGAWKSFERNFVRWHGNRGTGFEYGLTITDTIFVMDALGPDDNNPHYGQIYGQTGPVRFDGCIWWWTGTASNAEGDGPSILRASSGAPDDNIITFNRNIFLPNGNGPDGRNNLSATVFSVLTETRNNRLVARRNTVYTGGGIGGINLGETFAATAGQVAYVKSNLFVGDVDSGGRKMNDLGHSETDVFLAENVDYNAGYRIRDDASFHNGSGKGYGRFEFTRGDVVGANDIDDVDPQFVDPTRTPASWAGSLDATMDWLSPSGGRSMTELLEYIREGFRPQNPLLKQAGDPDDGSPDIGAVDLLNASMKITLPARVRGTDGTLRGAGRIDVSIAPQRNLVSTCSSTESARISVPQKLTIKAGTMSVDFDIAVTPEREAERSQRVRINCRTSEYGTATALIEIVDGSTEDDTTRSSTNESDTSSSASAVADTSTRGVGCDNSVGSSCVSYTASQTLRERAIWLVVGFVPIVLWRWRKRHGSQ